MSEPMALVCEWGPCSTEFRWDGRGRRPRFDREACRKAAFRASRRAAPPPTTARQVATAPAPAPAVPQNRKGRNLTGVYAEPKDCDHPVSRRYPDGSCGKCGTKVK